MTTPSGTTMIAKVIEDAVNEQIKHEFASAYTYFAMSAWLELKSFSGFAHWMRMQAQEEIAHAMRLLDYLNARQALVSLQPLAAPKADYDSVIHVLEETVAQERIQTARINTLYEKAQEAKAHATVIHLEWFITEQIEEEKTASQLLAQVRIVGNDKAGLLVIDRRLNKRTV